jgi:hypothetical protein
MDQSLSWETGGHSASQGFSRFYWNPKSHFRENENPPLVSMMSQIMTIPSEYRSLKTILILSSNLWPCSDSSDFPPDFVITILNAMHATWLVPIFIVDFITLITWHYIQL